MLPPSTSTAAWTFRFFPGAVGEGVMVMVTVTAPGHGGSDEEDICNGLEKLVIALDDD
jgi:hypothetical protein